MAEKSDLHQGVENAFRHVVVPGDLRLVDFAREQLEVRRKTETVAKTEWGLVLRIDRLTVIAVWHRPCSQNQQ